MDTADRCNNCARPFKTNARGGNDACVTDITPFGWTPFTRVVCQPCIRKYGGYPMRKVDVKSKY